MASRNNSECCCYFFIIFTDTMKFILGTKENMMQFFREDGTCIPATVLSAGPLVVTQVKSGDKDGYAAVQVGFGTQKKERVAKAQLSKMHEDKPFRVLREFRIDEGSFNVGDTIDVSVFAEGDTITVSGVSKGKGFQGVVKRHGFKGGRRTHGQKHSEREPGSIGGGGRAGGRVAKGMRMAGRMGSDRVTVKNLKVLAVDKDNNQILVSGAVPGKRGTLIEVRG